MKQPERPACVVTHGGAANRAAFRDGCERACDAARCALAQAARPLDAAMAAVVVLEDDPRMNAGTGATLRLDGASCQLDAAVMDARGFGAVAAVEDVKNPVRLARAVYDLPHMLLVGDGAADLADRLGIERGAVVTEAARARHAERLAALATTPFWRGHDPAEVLRLAGRSPDACDTVGAVVRDAQGGFAAAGSTGGIWCALRGRVGDVPIPGAGLYVGTHGAVAATGIGEAIWQGMLSERVHRALVRGAPAQVAVDEVLDEVRARTPDVDVGLIAVDAASFGGGCTREMPWSVWSGAA